MHIQQPTPRFYRRWCVYGRTDQALIASVALRAPHLSERPGAGSATVVLDEVWTARRHRSVGHATGLLRQAQSFALRSGWGIACRPSAHDSGLSPAALQRFYLERGFDPLVGHPGWLYCYPF